MHRLLSKYGLAFLFSASCCMPTLLAQASELTPPASASQIEVPATIHIPDAEIVKWQEPWWEKDKKSDDERAWESEVKSNAKEEFGGDLHQGSAMEAQRGFQSLFSFDVMTAFSHLNSAWILDSNNPYPYLGYSELARLHFRDLDKFEHYAQQALQKDPTNLTTLKMLGTNYAIEGNYTRAQEYLKRASKLAPHDTDVMETLRKVENQLEAEKE